MVHRKIKSKTIFLSFSVTLVLSLCLISSCYYDNEEQLYPDVNCQVTDVSYREDIIPIMESFCYSCHDLANAPALGDNINLEGHLEFSRYARDFPDVLLGSLKWDGGGSPMPKNSSRLDKCSINKIEVWMNEGRINN